MNRDELIKTATRAIADLDVVGEGVPHYEGLAEVAVDAVLPLIEANALDRAADDIQAMRAETAEARAVEANRRAADFEKEFLLADLQLTRLVTRVAELEAEIKTLADE